MYTGVYTFVREKFKNYRDVFGGHSAFLHSRELSSAPSYPTSESNAVFNYFHRLK